MKHREYSVGHSYKGFTLQVEDFPVLRWWAAQLAYWVVSPFDRGGGIITLPYRAVDAIFRWQHGQKTDVADIHLAAEQALAINPRYADETWITIDGADEDGDVYRDGALVRVHCGDCGEDIESAGRWRAKVMEDHAPNCPEEQADIASVRNREGGARPLHEALEEIDAARRRAAADELLALGQEMGLDD